MRTLYLECGMGAAGDMLAAALLELLPDADGFVRELNAIGIPGTVFKSEPSVKCGITGTHITVTVNGEEEESHDYSHELGQPQDHDHSHEVGQYHDHNHDHEAGQHQDHDRSHESGHHSDHDHSHESGHHSDHDHSHEAGHHHDHDHSHESGHHHHNHHHSGLHDIEHIVRGHLNLPERIQDHVMAVYGLIAEAESHAHGVPVTQIHFHEVGAMDAIADITAVCMLMDRLAVDEVVVSPVHVGSGQVRCAHGILPVPAPATAYILKDVPIYGGSVRGELCTPTGAALIKHFATRFGDMPVMKIQRIGYGMGKKDFEAANCVRAMLGETGTGREEICELSCNVDDMTGEAIGFAMDRLFEAGALDVYTVPVGMKKSRPGVLLCVMYRENDRDAIIRTVFKYTASIGIRENKLGRYVLDRRIEEVETVYGSIRCKVSSGYGVERRKYEYDDISRIAKENGVSLEEVVSKIQS
ncbi:MAG: nickel pincer cofactor biosynthesis protein LarC [Lachnospiraceae bacterium]|nr:nickel pincer cofactor biosynthesis protein LarC [Lachnospiraceae bacterium]